MKAKELRENGQEASKNTLLKLLKPGDTVYTDVTQVARSGMSRWIRLMLIRGDEIRRISYHVGILLDYRHDADKGLQVSGCGMNMCFEIVYNMGRVLFPNGYTCSGDNCQSNDHSNGDRNYKAHWHKDGGYAFKYRSI